MDAFLHHVCHMCFSISTYLQHDRSFVSLPGVEVNFLAPSKSAGSLCLFLVCLCQNSTSIVKGRGLCLPIRSEGLQVAERTRLITSSGKRQWGGDRPRDGRNRWGREGIRGKKGVIERGEEEKKWSRADREEVGDEERERESGRNEGK